MEKNNQNIITCYPRGNSDRCQITARHLNDRSAVHQGYRGLCRCRFKPSEFKVNNTGDQSRNNKKYCKDFYFFAHFSAVKNHISSLLLYSKTIINKTKTHRARERGVFF